MIRALFATAYTCAALLLTGCAAFNNLDNEVSTYGSWAAPRQPGSYAFERLPSQATRPQYQQQLEASARAAVEAAGFTPAATVADAEYLLQLGARVSTDDPWLYSDPFLWRGDFWYGSGWGHGRWGYGRWGRGPWGYGAGYGLGYGYGFNSRITFDREVVVLIRDRKTGELLFESRASNSGPSASIDYLLPAMFRAAMTGFPGVGPNPRSVTVPISAN